MRNNYGRILVTGSTGQIGSELTLALRDNYGKDNVVASWYRRKPGERLKSGPTEQVDVTDSAALRKAVKKYDIDVIYHLAAVLSAVGEKNPELAWHINMDGLHNVLEVARKEDVEGVFWPSSMAVFGKGAPRLNTPQDTMLMPRTIYGVAKVSGELLCNYYFNRYGLDVRCLRYPGIISSEALPGGGTTDYAVEIFYQAIQKGKYDCFVRKDTMLPMMYMPDCIEAAIMLMDSEKSRVKYRMGYNVTAMSFRAGELAKEIKKYIANFRCEFKPDFRQEIADSWPMSMDDSLARKEWGWRPTYDMPRMVKDMLTKLRKRLTRPDLT